MGDQCEVISEKHTAGPWAAVEERKEIFLYGKTHGCIAAVPLGSVPHFEQEARANAKLIAVAPEMLDVLVTIENDAGQVPMFLWKRIQEVVAKAGSRFARDPEGEDYVTRCDLAVAAPDMLESLEMCRELLQGQLDSDDGALDDGAISDALSDICKTITKAKGGSND